MSATVSAQQEKVLQRLLKTGRWNNKSEIVRHGIELVQREVQAEELAGVPDDVVRQCHAEMTAEEIEADRAMGRSSIRAQKGVTQ